jgi:hypothetical protein
LFDPSTDEAGGADATVVVGGVAVVGGAVLDGLVVGWGIEADGAAVVGVGTLRSTAGSTSRIATTSSPSSPA